MYRDETKNFVDTIWSETDPSGTYDLRKGQMLVFRQIDPVGGVTVNFKESGDYVAFFYPLHAETNVENGQYAISMGGLAPIQWAFGQASITFSTPESVRGYEQTNLYVASWVGCTVLIIRVR